MSDLFIQQVLNSYKSGDELQRKLDAEERLSLYKDESKAIIEEAIKSNFELENYTNIKQMVDDSINITANIVNETSKVYMYGADRRLNVNGEQIEDDRYQEILKQSMIDIVMDKANKYTDLLNECFLLCRPDGDFLTLDIITPDLMTVIQDQDDPRKIFAIIYEIILQDTQKSSISQRVGINTQDRQFIYYDTDGRHFKFDTNLRLIQNPENPENENPYKDKNGKYIIPGIMLHKQYNDNSIWDKTSGERMISAHKQIGVIASYFNYLLKVQTYKQMYARGNFDLKLTDKQLLDPLSVIKIQGENADIDLLDLQADITSFNTILDKKIERALNQEGLSLGDFQKSGSPESGYKLRIKKQPLIEKRNEQIKYYSVYEERLFQIMRIVNNTMFTNAKIADTAEFSIDHGEITIEDDPAERRQNIAFDIANNLTNYYEVIANERGVDIEQAKAIYEENKSINEQLTETDAARAALEASLNGQTAENIQA